MSRSRLSCRRLNTSRRGSGAIAGDDRAAAVTVVAEVAAAEAADAEALFSKKRRPDTRRRGTTMTRRWEITTQKTIAAAPERRRDMAVGPSPGIRPPRRTSAGKCPAVRAVSAAPKATSSTRVQRQYGEFSLFILLSLCLALPSLDDRNTTADPFRPKSRHCESELPNPYVPATLRRAQTHPTAPSHVTAPPTIELSRRPSSLFESPLGVAPHAFSGEKSSKR